jgi:hypothetical protein
LKAKDFTPLIGLIDYTRKGNKDIDNKIIEIGSNEDTEFLIGQTKLLFYNSAIILIPLGLEKLFFK